LDRKGNALKTTISAYEIIFIDDGSRDNSWKVIKSIFRKTTNIKGISFHGAITAKRPHCTWVFQAAKGDVVITMDADLQDSPEEIPELYRMITV
jgi:glycosyltransferase involved in cell wall biosynthesis